MTERVYLSIYENLFIGHDIIGLFACQLLVCSKAAQRAMLPRYAML
jgi:hypothetical protein